MIIFEYNVSITANCWLDNSKRGFKNMICLYFFIMLNCTDNNNNIYLKDNKQDVDKNRSTQNLGRCFVDVKISAATQQEV